MLISNWKQMWKSYSVITPALVSAVLIIIDSTVANNLLPEQYLPFVLIVSSFLGRIVKQDNLKDK